MAVLRKEGQYHDSFKASSFRHGTSHSTLLEQLKKSSTLLAGSRPPQYKLKFMRTLKGQGGKLEKCVVDYGTAERQYMSVADVEKVIMVVGATGAGKTTLINGYANYIYGIEWGDGFRLRVIDDSMYNQTQSQTKSITAYTFPLREGMAIDYTLTIIDTPGFGDTGGIARDREITKLIKDFFSVGGSEGIDQLHGVLFVTPASQPRLTATQTYIFETVLSIFGNDVANNIFLMTTFADGQKPKVIEAVKKAGVPYNHYFKFNNSALYADNRGTESDIESDDDDDGDSFDELSWKMGIKSFDRFYKKFDKVETQSLVLTREVMREREYLQLILKEMPKKIARGLSKMDELQQEEKVMRIHESDVMTSQGFKYTVTISKQRRVCLKGRGVHVTNCLQCNYTCHYDCAYANDSDKHKCSAMLYQADIEKIHCGVCTKKCGWRQHVNNPYMFEEYEEDEERTSEELRVRYEQATSKKTAKEQIIDGIKRDLQALENEVKGLIEQAKKHLEHLNGIALRPVNLSEVDYIDLLIEQEKNQGKPGFLERVKALEGFRKQAELVTAVSNVQLQGAASVFEQLREV